MHPLARRHRPLLFPRSTRPSAPPVPAAPSSVALSSVALSSVVLSAFLFFVFTGAARAQLLVSDFNLHQLVRLETTGPAAGSTAVFLAPGAGGLSLPHRARLGPDGALHVASAGTDQILRFDATTGAALAAFTGPSDGALDYPVDFVFRPDGYLYVGSQLTHTVLRYDSATGARDLAWSASHASLSGPSGLVFDDAGHLYVAGRFSNNVARFDAATGAHQLSFGAVPSAFGLALLPDGRLLAAAGATGTVQAFAAPASAAPAQSTFITGLSVPVGVEFDSISSTVLVAHYGTGALTRHATADGALLGSLLAPGGTLSGPNYFTLLASAPVPEPAAATLLAGLAALALTTRRRPASAPICRLARPYHTR
jgi:6-phosphogluconolactonase (cycloisomerase 2 family)